MSSRTPTRENSTEEKDKPGGGGTFSRFLFSRQSSKRKGSSESARSDRTPSPTDRPSTPTASAFSTGRRLAGFASRSLRKKEWRLFKHRTFFGSTKRNAHLQPPLLTLRHPSVDGNSMALTIDGEEGMLSGAPGWVGPHSPRLRGDSRDSSGFDGSSDQLYDHLSYAMTAPVSPSVPLSASSSQSEGWKYSSQKILWKLKPRSHHGNPSHNSSTSSSTDSAWKSLDSGTWRHSLDDKEITLRGTQLETLSDIERGALQLVAVSRLHKIIPGVCLSKNKDAMSVLRQKRQKLLKTSRTLTVGDVSRRPSGSSTDEEKRVFGVSLVDCMLNERRLDLETRCRSLDDSAVSLSVPRNARSESYGSKVGMRSEPEFIHIIDDSKKWLYPSTQNLYPSSSSHPSSPSPLVGSAPTSYSNPVRDTQSQHHLSDMSISVGSIQGRFMKKHRPSSASLSYSLDGGVEDSEPHTLRVPRIVENCTQYLMAYGLNSVGLFRVAGNSKRCRQLRSALEKLGGGIVIGDDIVENTTPHDVANLLKEYFRDLPQSLLPKEHYQAYISAAKLPVEDRIECLRLLVSLLHTPSMDTLYVLLKFLHEVSCHANDTVDDKGERLQGNRMDSRNLATLFAPCILRDDHEKLHTSLADNEAQVTIMDTMITNVEEIFRIPKDLQCKIFNKLRETEPSRLDRVLDGIARAEGLDISMPSPFPATLEEDSPRHNPSETMQNGKGRPKLQSQRSGSWPFSLRSPRSPRKFFPPDESIATSTNSCPSEPDDSSVSMTNALMETTLNNNSVTLAKPELQPATAAPPRSPSRDRSERLRSGAAAATRRLRNVVRILRWNSIARSSPNISNLQ